MRARAILASWLLVFCTLAPTARAQIDVGDDDDSDAPVSSTVRTPPVGLALRFGYGSDLEGLALNPFRIGLGGSVDFLSSRFPVYASVDAAYWWGDHTRDAATGYLSLRTASASAFLGYRQRITPWFALLFGIGAGAETLRVYLSPSARGASARDVDMMAALEARARFTHRKCVFGEFVARLTMSRHDQHWDPNDPSFASIQLLAGLGVLVGR